MLTIVATFLLLSLLANYQASREQQRTEEAAQSIAATITRNVNGNLQELQAVASSQEEGAWARSALALLRANRAVLRIERRDAGMEPREAKDTPFAPALFRIRPRHQLQGEAMKACQAAAGPGLPAFSATYYVPAGDGRGLEVFDVCTTHQVNGKTVGYTVETIGLAALLTAAMPTKLADQYEASFVEGNSTRLARAGAEPGQAVFRSDKTIFVPGFTLRLRVESNRVSPTFSLDFTTVITLLFIPIVYGWLATTTIQGRKKAQLSARIREKDAEIQHATRMAMVGEVASLISHEIGGPLMTILNYARAARNLAERHGSGLPPEVLETLDHMTDTARRSSKVVETVRDYVSRSEGERVEIPASTLVRDVWPLLELQARDHGAKIRLVGDDSCTSTIFCQRTMVEQVLLNLVRNSLQAMKAIPPERRLVEVFMRDASGGNVRFTVSDTGPGFPSKVLQRLQEVEMRSFSRIKVEGIGLGLSLCRHVVQTHGGKVIGKNGAVPALGSRLGGATVSFTLPRVDVQPTEDSSGSAPLSTHHSITAPIPLHG